MTNHEYILRVMRLVNPFECDSILWSVKGDEVRFKVDCSDVFHWATADCEEVTPENVSELERAYADVPSDLEGAEDESDFTSYQHLFAARMRKMRPQRPAYAHIDKQLWPLFDACGPERKDSPRKELEPVA